MDFANSAEVDIAYYVLNKKGEGMFYKDLVMQVIDLKNKPVQSLSTAIAEIYTLINMDSRFHHAGEGIWKLTEWIPQDVKAASQSTSSSTASSKSAQRRMRLLEDIQESAH